MKGLSKKGQVGLLAPTIISLVLAAVILILGLVMLQEVRDTEVMTNAVSVSIVNETISSVNEVGDYVAHYSDPAAADFALSELCTNASDGVVIQAANYTFSTAGLLTITADGGDTTFNNTDWKCSYGYNMGDQAFISTNATLVGLGTFGDFWEIIVLAIIITIVIGLLLATFAGTGKR